VILSVPSEDLANPWHFFTSSGDFCVIWGSQSGSTVSEYTKYGSYHYYKDDQFWGPVFTRQGVGEKGFGRDFSGNIWRTDGNEKTLIGEESSQEVINAGGEKESVQMFRLKGENKKWTADRGGGIFQLGPNGRLLQIGWVGWRKITTPKGETFAILMTKGVTADAKWAGRYDGRLYRDK
jgi:hypothetical protein